MAAVVSARSGYDLAYVWKGLQGRGTSPGRAALRSRRHPPGLWRSSSGQAAR